MVSLMNVKVLEGARAQSHAMADPDSVARHDLEQRIRKLLVATAEGADPTLDEAIPQVLRLLRERMRMDVVFVSEFTAGRREFRHVDQAPGHAVLAQGGGDPLEASWCQRVVDGRLPQFVADASTVGGDTPPPSFPVGTHISTPIVLRDGRVYGTLCAFSFGVNEGATRQDLEILQYAAKLTGNIIDAGNSA